jgi:DNA-binding NtrC family response regulator
VKKLVSENSRHCHRGATEARYTAFMVKPGHTKRGMRVLLVGLAGQQARELETILGGRRPRIIQAETCVDGWKRLHEATFDVLIVHETAKGGWRDLVAEAAAMGLVLPVVVASAKPDERLWVDALSAGAYDVIEVPFHPAETSRILLTAAQPRSLAASDARRRSTRLGSLGRAAALAVLPA